MSLESILRAVNSQDQILDGYSIYIPAGVTEKKHLMAELIDLGATIPTRGALPTEVPQPTDLKGLNELKRGWYMISGNEEKLERWKNTSCSHVILTSKWLVDSKRHKKAMPTKWYTVDCRFNLFLDPNTTAIRHVLTFIIFCIVIFFIVIFFIVIFFIVIFFIVIFFIVIG